MVVSAVCTGLAGTALADQDHDARKGERRGHERRDQGKEIQAQPDRGHHGFPVVESLPRFGGGRPLPPLITPRLRVDPRPATYGGGRYHYDSGYRHEHDRIVVAAPSLRVVVPFFPAYASTVWVGDDAYYYTHNYAPGPQSYSVMEGPPAVTELAPQGEMRPLLNEQGGVVELGPAGDATSLVAQGPAPQFFAYPRMGQNAQTQVRDRTECNDWALAQPGVTGLSDGNYLRAMSACLDGRGYTVR
jgi:hypothetical protein